MARKPSSKNPAWLLFFYSVPSRPVNSRMKIWRKLSRAGALQFKGAVYLLPFSDEHQEFFQWLVSEVAAMGGEAAYVKAETLATTSNAEVIALFDEQRQREYQALSGVVDECEMRLNSIQKGSAVKNIKGFSDQIYKAAKTLQDLQNIDFFSSRAGAALRTRVEALTSALKNMPGGKTETKELTLIPARQIKEYQGRTWTTRKRPFIDRMASAWLIRKFIDRKASFTFMDERTLKRSGEGTVSFDVSGGDFTHRGDLCTFEVLVKSFGLKDIIVKKIAEIVHELDIKDDRYRTADAKGLESVLAGIRKTAKDDADALEKGMAVFEMIYAAKT